MRSIFFVITATAILTANHRVAAQEKPTISFISPDIAADVGDDIEMTCTITNGQEYPIFWMRINDKASGPNLPISNGGNLLIRDKRFNLDHDVKMGTYTLNIKNVGLSDEATYQCQVVVESHEVRTADVKVQLRTQPEMKDDPETRRVQVVLGKTAQLTCSATGFPMPSITWFREDGHFLPDGRENATVNPLVISKVKKEDRGQYICMASNNVGTDQTRAVTLDVEFAPSIEIPRPRVAQALGYDAELVCQILGYPAPAIFWKKGNETIANTEGVYDITHFASQDDVTTTTLKIFSLEEKHFGKYTCEASNRHGSAKETLELYESEIPICPPVCGDIDLTNEGRIVSNMSVLYMTMAFGFITLVLF